MVAHTTQSRFDAKHRAMMCANTSLGFAHRLRMSPFTRQTRTRPGTGQRLSQALVMSMFGIGRLEQTEMMPSGITMRYASLYGYLKIIIFCCWMTLKIINPASQK